MNCKCGCGQPTNIARKTNTKLGHVKGQPLPYLTGHAGAAANRRPLRERFEEKVDKTDACWLWTGSTMVNGYGKMTAGGHAGKTVLAHRVAWELYRGPIPEGKHLDHLCRVRNCVNPDHLEPVGHGENLRRGLNGDLKTHCAHGHPWVPENIYVRTNGLRACVVCRRIRDKARWDGERRERQNQLRKERYHRSRDT